MAVIFERTPVLTDVPFHYCPGCGHGIVHRMVAEVIDELGIREKTAGVAPVGCAVFAYNYFDVDMYEAAHGRAPAVATGFKRVHPDKYIFTYQGDGDLASIGTAEIVIYGMTGGQMAPTSLVGQKTTTSPLGRDKDHCGEPIRIAEMLSTINGSAFIARTALNSTPNLIKTKAAIKKAFETQIAGKGFSLVEVLSPCPTNWGKSPAEAMDWINDAMIPYYPLGIMKEV